MADAPSSLLTPGIFALPPLSVARHPGVLLTPRQLKAWIGTLPLANPPRSASQLLQQLRLLVRDPQPGNRFAALLELYDEPVRQLLEVVVERQQANADSAPPLDQLEFLLIEVMRELAAGHLRIANSLLNSRKSLSAETLSRALSLLDAALGIERLHYHRLSPESWQTVLNIYLHAEQQGISDRAMPAAVLQQDAPKTIRGLFFRSLVISICDPHRHRPADILTWMRWSAEHVNLLKMALLPQGAFAIPFDISGTLPPLAGARRGRPGPETRYLLTDDFLQAAKEQAAASAGLHRVLADLIKGRKAPEQRQSPRQPRNHPYRLFYGLRNIHDRLNELTRGSGTQAQALYPVAGRQVNQSRTGAAFHIAGPLNPPMVIGEPVLAEAETRSPGAAPVGFTASVKRIVAGDGQTLEIGVDKLQGRLIPVTISGQAMQRSRGEDRALLQQATDTGRYTLMAPRNLYHEGETITVEGPNTRFHLRMKTRLGLVQNIAMIEVEAQNL